MSKTSTRDQQAEELGTAEQFQEARELATMGGGGVEVESKSASIKSILVDSIQSCMACRSASGLRRQLGIRKNERKGENDEPDAPLCWWGRTWPGRFMWAKEENKAIKSIRMLAKYSTAA